MKLPNNNISIMDVRNILMYPSIDLGTLCKCDNVNQWAEFKPYSYPSDSPSSTIRFGKQGSGFTYIENNRTPFKYYTVVYNKPYGTSQSPYRLGDFRGYNHNSYAPELRKLNADYPAFIPDNDIVINPSTNKGEGKIQIKFPDIPPSKMPDSPHQSLNNTVAVIDYVNSKKNIIWSVDFNTENYDNYKNTEKVIDLEISEGLPASTTTVSRDIYLEFSGFETSSLPIKISRTWNQNPNDDIYWRSCLRTMQSENNILSYFDFSDNTVQYLIQKDNTERAMIRLKDLKVKSIAAEWVFDLYVQNASGVWQIVARFSKVNTTSAKCILCNNSTYFE